MCPALAPTRDLPQCLDLALTLTLPLPHMCPALLRLVPRPCSHMCPVFVSTRAPPLHQTCSTLAPLYVQQLPPHVSCLCLHMCPALVQYVLHPCPPATHALIFSPHMCLPVARPPYVPFSHTCLDLAPHTCPSIAPRCAHMSYTCPHIICSLPCVFAIFPQYFL